MENLGGIGRQDLDGGTTFVILTNGEPFLFGPGDGNRGPEQTFGGLQGDSAPIPTRSVSEDSRELSD